MGKSAQSPPQAIFVFAKYDDTPHKSENEKSMICIIIRLILKCMVLTDMFLYIHVYLKAIIFSFSGNFLLSNQPNLNSNSYVIFKVFNGH